jgi:hypothetical protein
MITTKFPKSGHTPVFREDPSYPRPKAGQSLQGAQIAARSRSNDAFRAPEPNFRTFREKSVKIPQKREGTHFGKKN